VELHANARVVSGKIEFACDYAGRVFLFDTEENQGKFLANPR
jgi:adenylate/nucleoside-diphosphate kinase